MNFKHLEQWCLTHNTAEFLFSTRNSDENFRGMILFNSSQYYLGEGIQVVPVREYVLEILAVQLDDCHSLNFLNYSGVFLDNTESLFILSSPSSFPPSLSFPFFSL